MGVSSACVPTELDKGVDELFGRSPVPTCNCDTERTGHAQPWFDVQVKAPHGWSTLRRFDPLSHGLAVLYAKKLQAEKPKGGPFRVIARTEEQIYETRSKS